ncbi:hypothetical protein BJP40_11250 [Streptomyces sp. CC53]|uniref:hypothetical protein n=1 Tax=Streptomyces sp. CC53 TaxID=1906740 RepID=UPI0008DDFC8F|nr:hypothetical protein [Streptomyces sp. CC53]OII60199.1 hypothetical protein BJP40_11250 [Streptomyces sp. CC53]
MSPAELKLIKTESPDTAEESTTETTTEETTEKAPLPTRLAIAAGAALGIGAGLLVLNIAVGLAWQLHQLHLWTWLLIVIYCFVGGAVVRLFNEREKALKAITLQWAQYRAWATDDLPDRIEKAAATARTVRGWVWETKEKTA